MNPEVFDRFVSIARLVPGWRVNSSNNGFWFPGMEPDSSIHLRSGLIVGLEAEAITLYAIERALESWDKENGHSGVVITMSSLHDKEYKYDVPTNRTRGFAGYSFSRLEAAMMALVACYEEPE